MTDVFICLFFFLKKKSCYLFQLPAVPGSLWDWGLVLWPGIEPVSPSPVEERGSNHWTTREFPFLTVVFITRDRQADRGRRPCDNWIRNQSDAAPRQGCQRLPAAPRRQERGLGQILHRPCPPPHLPLPAPQPQRNQLCWCLDIRLPVPRPVREISAMSSPQLMVLWYRSPRTWIQPPHPYWTASLVAQMAKNLPAMWETRVRSLGLEDSLEEGMATHSNILAWRIPWTEEPGRLQSMRSQRAGHNWVTKQPIPIIIHILV